MSFTQIETNRIINIKIIRVLIAQLGDAIAITPIKTIFMPRRESMKIGKNRILELKNELIIRWKKI